MFSIDIDNFLKLPASVYWKDTNFRYYGSNEGMTVILGGLNSPSEVAQCYDHELMSKYFADIYREEDKQILKDEQPLIRFAPLPFMPKEKTVFGITLKLPLYDEDEKLAGLFGISVCQELLEHYNISTVLDPSTNLVLNPREKECLALIRQGKTNKMIAKSLGISFRTVEKHVASLLKKFQCNNRSELIMKSMILGGLPV